ncbi:MAG: GGDEF domain-containing protein [Planctomycetota bacterium]
MIAYVNLATWALIGAAVIGPALAVLISLRDRNRLTRRLSNLEDVLRRMRSSDPAGQFDDRPEETSLELSRERLVLTSLLDRFPEVTKEFVAIKTVDRLGQSIIHSFQHILGCEFGVVFLRDHDILRLYSQKGLAPDECAPNTTVPMTHGRIGYAASKGLILRPEQFASLDHDVLEYVEKTRVLAREFEYYIPLVHDGEPLGCVAIGGIKRPIQKAHTVSMALANLGALVLTNLMRAEEIRKLSQTDPLTQLSNRRHFYAQLDRRLGSRDTAPFALVLFDIDHFKRINDDHGHHIGDEVLVQVADVARGFVREDENEFACRFGGEEFICVVNAEDIPALGRRLEQLRADIARVAIGGEEGVVRVSGGVSFCPAEREEADPLIQLADARLYRAKEDGRDRIYLESEASEVSP